MIILPPGTETHDQRQQDLLRWTNQELWPTWELVIYYCRVSREECDWVIQALLDMGERSAARRVMRSTMDYFKEPI